MNKDNIIIREIKYNYMAIYSDSCIDNVIDNIETKWSYNDTESITIIPTNKIMNVDEVKKCIINQFE